MPLAIAIRCGAWRSCVRRIGVGLGRSSLGRSSLDRSSWSWPCLICTPLMGSRLSGVCRGCTVFFGCRGESAFFPRFRLAATRALARRVFGCAGPGIFARFIFALFWAGGGGWRPARGGRGSLRIWCARCVVAGVLAGRCLPAAHRRDIIRHDRDSLISARPRTARWVLGCHASVAMLIPQGQPFRGDSGA